MSKAARTAHSYLLEIINAIAWLPPIGRDTIREHLEVVEQAGLLEGPVEVLPSDDALMAVVQARVGAPALATQSSSVSS
jgi:hypothetical protein